MQSSQQVNIQNMIKEAESIRAKDLLNVLNRYEKDIKFLSLDCFDTILWRKTATPKDVFFELQKKSIFKSIGMSGRFRARAEHKVREAIKILKGTDEVNLSDIYRYGFQVIDNNRVNELVEEELLVEKEICYAFHPMIELMRESIKRNIKIIIVSDIYFNEGQLKSLLSHLLPTDVANSIYKIFCSCDYKKSKSKGLFQNVIHHLDCHPNSILHIGDNIMADYVMARQFQMKSLHFIHSDESIIDLTRLKSISAKLFDTKIGIENALYDPFHAIFSTYSFNNNYPEKLIGYASLGPIMYAFASFIENEMRALKKSVKNPKIVFLMRDGYLPSLACKELMGEEIGKCVHISRFSSYAASFYSIEDIEKYISEIGGTNRFHDLARQLLLPEQVSRPLIHSVMRSANPESEFLKLIRRQDIIKIILKRSEKYRSRLMKYLKKEINLSKGDTLVLIDLGYSGTTQRCLAPVFEKEGVQVIGRYLLSLRVPGWQGDRSGLIDPTNFDDRSMETLVLYIMLFEQLCTNNGKSVIDYDENGDPIYSEMALDESQNKKVKSIQLECLNFIADAKNFFIQSNILISLDILRQSALTELTRLIFFSTEIEIQYLKSLQGEVNLGTKDVLNIFDPDKGLSDLRRRGMFYMERPSHATRVNYPAELRVAGIELLLSLIIQNRFGLELRLKDMLLRKEIIKIIFQQGNEIYKTETEAIATHDGFFSIWLPTQHHISILLGETYRWVQIESAEFIPIEAFISQSESQNTTNALSSIGFDHVKDAGGQLYEMASHNSAIKINPVSLSGINEFVFRLVFRPIVKHNRKMYQSALSNAI